MRLLAVAGPILRDVIPIESHDANQDPACLPVSPPAKNLCIKVPQLLLGQLLLSQNQFLVEHFSRG